MKNCHLFITVFLLFFTATLFGQFTVTGKVIDSISTEPLYGASVFCQNTTSGTTTNKQGEFSLSLKSGGYELIVSFTGYQTKEIRITGTDNAPLQIQMIKE